MSQSFETAVRFSLPTRNGIGCDVPPELPLTQSIEVATIHEASYWSSKLLAVQEKIGEMAPEVYQHKRDGAFPKKTKGSYARFRNRAGIKLSEVMHAGGVWNVCAHKGTKWRSRIGFVDLCGGPGAFSAYILEFCRKRKIRADGLGMTLNMDDDDKEISPLSWYTELRNHPYYDIVEGVDNTGNIFNPLNVEELTKEASKLSVRLVVADGGFEISADQHDKHEFIHARIIFSQWYAACRCLVRGGCLVLKMFDFQSSFTRSLLWVIAGCFENVTIMKTPHSRPVNSERYLVACGYIPLDEHWLTYFSKIHAESFADASIPVELIPLEKSTIDGFFTTALNHSNNALARRQTAALKYVIDYDQPEKRKRDEPE